MRLRVGIAGALIAAGFCSVASAQHAVLIVRHAEKQTDANEPEVPLSEAGRARAKRLAAHLRDAGITAIYATDTVRARATAAPLAEVLKLDIATYEPRESLRERLRMEQPAGVVLVVGHSNTVPELLAALGHKGDAGIAPDEFDNLFVLVPKKDGSPTVFRFRY
jgi:broad specificity phosphatase PhoE